MNTYIKGDKSGDQMHIVIVSDTPDRAKKLEEELEQMGYKISIDTDPGARTSSLVNDAILRVTSADNVDLTMLQEQEDQAFVIAGAEAFQAAPARDTLRGDYKETDISQKLL